MGEYLLGSVEARLNRIATGFGGGVGETQQELCGALSGGIMLIGALYGRTRADEDDTQCMNLVASYREGFAQELGSTCCANLRASGFGSGGLTPCSVLVERAVRVLLEVLARV